MCYIKINQIEILGVSTLHFLFVLGWFNPKVIFIRQVLIHFYENIVLFYTYFQFFNYQLLQLVVPDPMRS